MNAQKAFRAKLNAKKHEKQRIDSPLVRYNEHDQPVCRVCDVVIKSESNWPAHQVSRKHHEAIDKLKATASAQNRPTASKSEATAAAASTAKVFPKAMPESSQDVIGKPEPLTAVRAHQSSTLPPDFFDNPEKKRQKNERDSSHRPSVETRNPDVEASMDGSPVANTSSNVVSKQVKGALPAGFFDDKDADLRARGIKPVKPDVKDEYKEFEKSIQEDLQEVDNRLEEEEFVAAEVIEEEETVEQRAYLERVEMLRRKKRELRAVVKDAEVANKKPSREDSSSDDEEDAEKVDWRSKRL